MHNRDNYTRNTKGSSMFLDRQYIAIFMDVMFLSPIVDTAQKECVLFVMGISQP